MIGKEVSHFRILEELGRGGMGVVYKAEDLKLTRIVALKFLPHGIDAQKPERDRFVQEARAAAILNHPNICTIYDIQEDNGQQFIVMECVQGKTIRERIAEGGLQTADAIRYAIQIAEALQEAHTHGIVHRDIKSENIMVNTKNQVKVMDFGLAKLKGSLRLTETSSTVGTLAYMAPEQLQGGESDARSDIFSFGIVLYEMLTGHLPFHGEHTAAMMYSILSEEPVPIQDYLPSPSPDLVHIVNRALEKMPEERYQSVHDVAVDLRRAENESRFVTMTPRQRIPLSATEKKSVETSVTPTLRSRKRKFYIASVTLAAIALVAAWQLFLPGEQHLQGLYPFSKFTPLRIATQGMPLKAAISPDGRYIIYAAEESGQQSVWIRQTSALSSLRILPPEDVQYIGFTFSPDGDRIFYSVTSQSDTRGALYVVPSLGGTPRKVASNIEGAADISPDGTALAFFRIYPGQGEEALMVCSADGSDERKLVSRKGEDFFTSSLSEVPAWSPDGRTIAASAGSTAGRFHMSILLVNVADGTSHMATSNRWDNVGRIAWTNGGKGMLFVAREYLTEGELQLWYLDLSTHDVRRITEDLNSYDGSSLSITQDQKKLVTLQQTFNSEIQTLPDGDSNRAHSITPRNAYHEGGLPTRGIAGAGLDWTPDGRIVFHSFASGNYDIWIMDADGRNRRQLTTDLNAELSPSVSWDGQFIAYTSTRDTTPHAWRMDLEGGNQKQLTTGVMDDYQPQYTPDSRWIFFSSFRDNGRLNVWKISADGGDPTKLTDDIVDTFGIGISPDGNYIVGRFLRASDQKMHWAILSRDDGKQRKVFDLPITAFPQRVRWMPDGNTIAYIDTRDGISNIWVLPLGTMELHQLTHFSSGLIANFAWSKDGRNLAVVRGEQTNDVVLLTDQN